MKTSRIVVGVLAAVFTGTAIDSVLGCVMWPPGFPRGCITFNSSTGCFEARVKGYKTMGASVGETCACGLGNASSSFLAAIKNVRMVHAGTNTDVAGFVWAHNATASAAWQAAGNKPFAGFLAPVTATVPSGLAVDFIFEVSRRAGNQQDVENAIDKSCLGTDEWDPKANNGKGGLKKSHQKIKQLKSHAPDLVVRGLTPVNATLVAGQPVKLSVTTANIGDDASVSTDTVFVLSTDTVISTSDRLLGFYATGAIAANGSVTKSVNGNVPWCVPNGRCWIGAIADGAESEVEQSETNNTTSTAAQCRAYADADAFVAIRPRYPNVTFDNGQVSASSGGKIGICMLSPANVGHFYLTLWSASPQFQFDAWTSLALSQLNNPIFHQWFGLVGQNGQGSAELNFGTGLGVRLRKDIQVYLHGIWISPRGQVTDGKKHKHRGHVTILK